MSGRQPLGGAPRGVHPAVMRSFLEGSREAFRTVHGLPPVPPSAATGECVNDAGTLFAAARRHRVAGLWAAGLDLSSRAPSMAGAWQRVTIGQALFTARLTAEAERLHTALAQRIDGLRLIKGPTLDVQAWPCAGLRSFDDLDLRCPREHGRALTDGLRAMGYRPVVEGPNHHDHLWQFGWGVSFRHPDGFLVECNHRLFPPHYPGLARAIASDPRAWGTLALERGSVAAPRPPLQLLVACLHALWHGWERLGWVADIAGLLVRHDGVFDEALAMAPREGLARRALRVGCATADRLFGPLPAAMDLPTRWTPCVEQAEACLLDAGRVPEPRALRRLHRQLMDSREAWRYDLLRLATPGDSDFRSWSLPPRLRPLYWLLRPLRRVRRLGRSS